MDTSGILDFIKENAFWAGPIVALVTFGESLPFIGILIPATTFLIAVGALAFSGTFDLFWILGWAIPGAIAGNATSYWFGCRFEHSIPTWGSFRKRPELLVRSRKFFERHGGKSIFVARFFGPLRCTIPLTAGMMGMPLPHFYVCNVLSAIAWAPIVLAWGAVVGTVLLVVSESEHKVEVMLAVGAVLVLAGVWLARSRLVPLPRR